MSESSSKGVRRAWVFAGGDYSTDFLPMDQISKHDQFICVDRGVEHCLLSGLQPTLLVGDFDSAEVSVLNRKSLSAVPRRTFSTEKSHSDLNLAMQILSENPPEQVVLLGVSGGRTDHMLFNWMLPAKCHWPYAIRIIDGGVDCHVLQGIDSCSLDVSQDQLVSLVPLGEVTGVTTAGLVYALEKATLTIGTTLGLSNVASAGSVTVTIGSGTLLVMCNV